MGHLKEQKPEAVEVSQTPFSHKTVVPSQVLQICKQQPGPGFGSYFPESDQNYMTDKPCLQKVAIFYLVRERLLLCCLMLPCERMIIIL